MKQWFRLKLACCACFCLVSASAADAAELFYKGKTVTTLVSVDPGGSYDLVARIVARYLPKYLDGSPTAIVQNMPGGGGKTLSNYLYNVAPKDGTSIAILNQTLGLDQILSDDSHYNTARFEWLGRVGPTTTLVMVYKGAPATSLQDMKQKEVIFAGEGKSSQTYMVPTLMRTLLGFKTRVVMGYTSVPEVLTAMERGEVQGRTGDINALLSSRPDWLTNGNIQILGEFSLNDEPSIPGLPLLVPMGADPKTRELLDLVASYTAFGYPYAAPPGTPPERVAMLQKAFDSVMKDPNFLSDMKLARTSLDPRPAAYIQNIASKFDSVSPDLLDRMKKALEW